MIFKASQLNCPLPESLVADESVWMLSYFLLRHLFENKLPKGTLCIQVLSQICDRVTGPS